MSMASVWAIAAPISCPISSSKYGKCHWSGASMTPSSDTNSDTITFLIGTSSDLVCGCGWYTKTHSQPAAARVLFGSPGRLHDAVERHELGYRELPHWQVLSLTEFPLSPSMLVPRRIQRHHPKGGARGWSFGTVFAGPRVLPGPSTPPPIRRPDPETEHLRQWDQAEHPAGC